MAYSPTPRTTSANRTSSSNPFYRFERRSPSPPAQQTATNKREKRKDALKNRLTEISLNFAENRDANYRKQLQQSQADINFINGAQLYENRPLAEPGQEDDDTSVVNGADGRRQPLSGPVNGSARHETQPKLGRHAAMFVHEVNDAMETRDVDLTGLAYNFNFSIQQYQKDYKFAVEVAEIEHQRLLKSLRQQLIANVQHRKFTLHREKEKLDVADANALLHYPNQFSVNNTASPGGAQSNRKTRHTRHRLDADDLDTAINNSTTNGKRKRKAAADIENSGSPGPTQAREMESTTILPTTNNGFKDTQARLEIQPVPPPAYTLNRLFTDRELNANLQKATYEVIRSYTSVSTNGNSNNNNSSNANNKRRKANLAVPTDPLLPTTTTDHTDLEDNTSLPNPNPDISNFDGTAPDTLALTATATAVTMDRTPSQLYHATRSTNRLQASTTSDPKASLGELAGRHSAADLIGSYGRANEKPKKADGDDYQRAPALTDQEALDDVRLMEAAMRRVEAAIAVERGRGVVVKGANAGGRGRRQGGEENDDDEDDDDENDGGDGEEVVEDAGVDRKVLELAVGEVKEDFVGPAWFAREMDGGGGGGSGRG